MLNGVCNLVLELSNIILILVQMFGKGCHTHTHTHTHAHCKWEYIHVAGMFNIYEHSLFYVLNSWKNMYYSPGLPGP